MKKFIVGLLLCLTLAGCSSQNSTEQSSKKASEVTSESSKSSSTRQSSSETQTTTAIFQAKDSEESAEAADTTQKLAEYNSLPENIKVWLATTTVDERAHAANFREYYINYNIDSNNLIVNLSSGAGIGHPVYLLTEDDEFVYPTSGFVLVDQSAEAVYENAPVNTTPVSKLDLLNDYHANRQTFEANADRVTLNSQFTTASFNEMRNKIQ